MSIATWKRYTRSTTSLAPVIYIQYLICSMAFVCFLFFLCLGTMPSEATEIGHSSPYVLYIDRMSKQLWVVDGNHNVMVHTSISIGSGGVKKKVNMDDCVTPTGKFIVDLILFKDKHFNRIATNNLIRYRRTKFYNLLISQDSLAQLFSNMNNLDFDGDGKSDHIYGDGYIGLTATSKGQITGPKMQYFKQIPYWYSIALHGTNDPNSIGKATSGGCIHLPATIISRLIVDGLVGIGTKVLISDLKPTGIHYLPN